MSRSASIFCCLPSFDMSYLNDRTSLLQQDSGEVILEAGQDLQAGIYFGGSCTRDAPVAYQRHALQPCRCKGRESVKANQTQGIIALEFPVLGHLGVGSPVTPYRFIPRLHTQDQSLKLPMILHQHSIQRYFSCILYLRCCLPYLISFPCHIPWHAFFVPCRKADAACQVWQKERQRQTERMVSIVAEEVGRSSFVRFAA